jgi:hypothetical protein
MQPRLPHDLRPKENIKMSSKLNFKLVALCTILSAMLVIPALGQGKEEKGELKKSEKMITEEKVEQQNKNQIKTEEQLEQEKKNQIKTEGEMEQKKKSRGPLE